MQMSHSRVECFNSCPYKYYLRYKQKMEVLPNDDPSNALFLGTALHTGIEKDAETAIQEYYMSYPVIDDRHVNEAIKLEAVIAKARKAVPQGQHEVSIYHKDFIGFIDLLAPAYSETKLGGEYQKLPGVYDLYDFKYSNNVSHYMDSPQLHLYKYFYEQTHPGHHIRNLYFLFVPKVTSKQGKNEPLHTYRKRIQEELAGVEPKLVEVQYDPEKVINYMMDVKHLIECDDFNKNPQFLCKYCDYQDYCQKGKDFMILPSNERRTVGKTTKRKLWIYGAAFSGKTTFLDKAPNPLNLNTDGNIQFVTMPYIPIKDEVTVTGRMTNRKPAWEVFKEAIAELEKKQNDFDTIIVDLLEDTREMCRLYKYDEMGIDHESDAGFGKGWDIIKTEYLSTIRRLFNLDYENIIVVSHEDVSKDITKKNGQNITRIAPNIQDGIANKIAGMVDIVARVVVEDDGSRTLNFKQNEVIFGGGRLKGITKTSIPLDWDALMEVYDEANSGSNASQKATDAPKKASRKKVEEVSTEDTNEAAEASGEATEAPEAPSEPVDEAPVTVEPNSGEVMTDASEKEDAPAPKVRTRKRRTVED